MGILTDISINALEKYGEDTVKYARVNLDRTRSRTTASGTRLRSKINNTGNLSRNLYSQLKVNENSFEMTIGAKGTAAKYADVQESGRRKGKYVPLKPLRDWIRKKVKMRDPQGRFVEKTDARVEQMARNVSKKIHKYGIKGKHFMRTASNKAFKHNRESIEGALFKDMEQATLSVVRRLENKGVTARKN